MYAALRPQLSAFPSSFPNSGAVFLSPLDSFQVFGFHGFSNFALFGAMQLTLLCAFLLLVLGAPRRGAASCAEPLPTPRQAVHGAGIAPHFFAVRDGLLLGFAYAQATVAQLAPYYAVFFVFLFVALASLNVLGLFPYGFTLTSHIFFTFCAAFSLFFSLNYLFLSRFGRSALALFLPGGTPFMIAPILALIELVSYLSRVFSLAIRLFANIMAGHTLMHILLGVVVQLCLLLGFFLLLAALPLGLSQLIFFMETGIALLQAYVFFALALNYAGDLLGGHH
jgi:ATP synthase subunit 6